MVERGGSIRHISDRSTAHRELRKSTGFGEIWRMPGGQRPEKILIAMRELSGGRLRPIKYEDIVVKAFELFPEEFALRGHPKYPDSSDIHKPLYGPLKRHGYIRANNRMFTLAEKGLSKAAELASPATANPDRLDRADEAELRRIIDSETFGLFVAGKQERLLDTDFYSHLGVTVRTPRNDFLGRLAVVQEAVTKAARLEKDPKHIKAKELHDFLVGKFASIVERMKGMTAG